MTDDPLDPTKIEHDFQRALVTDIIANTLWRHGKMLGWEENRIIKTIMVAMFRRHELQMAEALKRLQYGTPSLILSVDSGRTGYDFQVPSSG